MTEHISIPRLSKLLGIPESAVRKVFAGGIQEVGKVDDEIQVRSGPGRPPQHAIPLILVVDYLRQKLREVEKEAKVESVGPSTAESAQLREQLTMHAATVAQWLLVDEAKTELIRLHSANSSREIKRMLGNENN